MDLPAEQLDLLRKVADANPRVVVVLSNGAAVTVADWAERVPAILEDGCSARVVGPRLPICSSASPTRSGRLTETIPWRLADNPSFGNFPRRVRRRALRRRRLGRLSLLRCPRRRRGATRSGTACRTPASSTAGYRNRFRLGRRRARRGLVDGHQYRGAVRPGGRPAVRRRSSECSVMRPVRELRGFAKVARRCGSDGPGLVHVGRSGSRILAPGVAALGRRGWRVRDRGRQRRRATSGSARSSRSSASPPDLPLTADSTLAEWLADPTAREALESVAPSDFGALGMNGRDGQADRARYP